MILGGVSELKDYLMKLPINSKIGFVDTSILFSASYTPDKFNEHSEKAFEDLAKTSIPIVTNQNVRSEYVEQHRRVLIADCLVDFYEQLDSQIPTPVGEKLKSHRTIHKRKINNEEDTKLSPRDQKDFRKLLSSFSVGNVTGWEFLCVNYLRPQLMPIWNDALREYNLSTLTSRSGEKNKFLSKDLDWDDAVDIMGNYGIASSDAMILNMFMCSTIPFLLTADVEMAKYVKHQNLTNKDIFLPDPLLSEI